MQHCEVLLLLEVIVWLTLEAHALGGVGVMGGLTYISLRLSCILKLNMNFHGKVRLTHTGVSSLHAFLWV